MTDIRKLIQKLFANRVRLNQNGNVLAIAFITMVVIGISISSIAQITVNQYTTANARNEFIEESVVCESFLKLAISEFEAYIDPDQAPEGDFASYEATEIPNVLTNYGVTVTNVTGTAGFEEFGETAEGESRVYRFSCPTDSGRTLVMYSYVSNVGTEVEQLDPFDFSLATNGHLILNGGYLRDAGIFAGDIHFGYVSPYIEKTNGGGTLTPELTPTDSGAYPDFNGNGSASDVYFTNSYTYCPSTCFTVGPTINDPFEYQDSLVLDIEGSGLETGTVNGDKIIADFFGSFSLQDQIVDYVKNDGPTLERTISDPMSISNIASVVLANSGAPEEECELVKIKGKWTEVCTYGASTEPYTDLTSVVDFDPSSEAETVSYGAIYDGNLTISEDFTITNFETETFIVTGDLTFDNAAQIDYQGIIVVLGDLYFSGQSIAIEGGFYVVGQTYIEFDEGEGFEDAGGGNSYSFALLGVDNIFLNSMFESHNSSSAPTIFDWVVYTEESIYMDLVNSRLQVNGIFFAAARDNSGNYIPVEDENGDPIHGIVINSYRGYINNSGQAVPASQTNRNSFIYDVVNEASLQDSFVELPVFETVVVSEGTYSFERSELIVE